jgi:drug/metabolite transporter (DMT)-like permease
MLRHPLSNQLPAATIVFWEHLLAVVVLVPFLPSALRAFRRATVRERWALVPRALTAALLAVAAAALWAIGTVLGRTVGATIAARDVTVLRLAIGLPASAVVLALQGGPLGVTAAQLGPLALLALVPGLLSLVLYYVGLRTTAASRATLAEMAFPVTAALLGVGVLGTQLSATRWVGLAVVIASVAGLGLRERTDRPVVQPATTTSQPR